MTTVPARTALFAVRSYRYAQRRRPYNAAPGRPVVRLTAPLVAQVALDEAILSVMMSPRRLPHRADYVRVEAEILAARELYRDKGWIADPVQFHETPPPLAAGGITERPGRSMGQSYRQLSFASDYEPHELEPGRDRWLDREANRTAGAWVMRHADDAGSDGRPRPWLVCIPGFGTGTPVMDIPAFRSWWMHRRLGVNLVFPTLPLHGPRRAGRMSGDGFMSFDHLDGVHALAQSIWDIRRLLTWVRAQGAEQVGVYGVSLGGYVAALLVSLEDGICCAMAGIPPTDFPALFAHHSPKAIRSRAARYRMIGPEAREIHRVMSPLAIPPRTPWDGRYIYAGIGDRMSTPAQASKLWEHWDRPAMVWYPGNHVGYLWSGKVHRFVSGALTASGLA